MSSHSSVQILSEKLARKLESDRQQIETITQRELDALAQRLKRQSGAVLSTTLDDIESGLRQRLDSIRRQIEAQITPLQAALAGVRAEAETLQALTFRGWLKPLALSLSILLGVAIGSWALMQWLSDNVMQLAQQIEQQKQTLAQIEKRTWGLELYQSKDGGRYLLLPPGVEAETGWKIGQRPAVLLRSD